MDSQGFQPFYMQSTSSGSTGGLATLCFKWLNMIVLCFHVVGGWLKGTKAGGEAKRGQSARQHVDTKQWRNPINAHGAGRGEVE